MLLLWTEGCLKTFRVSSVDYLMFTSQDILTYHVMTLMTNLVRWIQTSFINEEKIMFSRVIFPRPGRIFAWKNNYSLWLFYSHFKRREDWPFLALPYTLTLLKPKNKKCYYRKSSKSEFDINLAPRRKLLISNLTNNFQNWTFLNRFQDGGVFVNNFAQSIFWAPAFKSFTKIFGFDGVRSEISHKFCNKRFFHLLWFSQKTDANLRTFSLHFSQLFIF